MTGSRRPQLSLRVNRGVPRGYAIAQGRGAPPGRTTSDRVRSVSTVPGATAFTRIPLPASSLAAATVSIRTAPFDVSYGTMGVVDAVNAEVDARLMIAPRRRGAITRAAAWSRKNTPLRLTSMRASNLSGVTSRSGITQPTPALFTTVASGAFASASRTTSRMASTFVTSSSRGWTAIPSDSNSRAARVAPSMSTSARNTTSPRRPRRAAMASPIPLAPPVMRAPGVGSSLCGSVTSRLGCSLSYTPAIPRSDR